MAADSSLPSSVRSATFGRRGAPVCALTYLSHMVRFVGTVDQQYSFKFFSFMTVFAFEE